MEKRILTASLRENTVNIRTIMNNSSDLILKYTKIAGCDVCFVFCEGMVDNKSVTDMIYRPFSGLKEDYAPNVLMEKITGEMQNSIGQTLVYDFEELAYLIISGFCVILIGGVSYAYAIGVQGFKTRSIAEPSTSHNIRASRESFTENIRTNITILRRRLKTPELILKMSKLGKVSKTDICVCYLKGQAGSHLIKEVERRLSEIDIDTVLEGGYIQSFLEDKGNVIFQQTGYTEHPDILAAKIFEGRVAIIVDGTPFVMFIPILFGENFQTMDDYTGNSVYTGFMRILKYIAFLMTVLLPGLYIAVANFRPVVLPNALLFNLEKSISETPFPLLTECIIIHILYDIMREAGLRLPKYVGHAVSIVGGLVIGQIIVSANLVGAPLVLIVAITALSSFVIPDMYDSVIILRYGFILAGGFFGPFGVNILLIGIMFKMLSMNGYGVPYLSPFVPFSLKGMRDAFIRVNWRKMSKGNFKISDLPGVYPE